MPSVVRGRGFPTREAHLKFRPYAHQTETTETDRRDETVSHTPNVETLSSGDTLRGSTAFQRVACLAEIQ